VWAKLSCVFVVFFGKVFPSGAIMPRVLASDTGGTDGIEDEKDLLAFLKIPSVERWGELAEKWWWQWAFSSF